MRNGSSKLRTPWTSSGRWATPMVTGTAMAVGEGLRELVRKRRQQRLTYWSTAGVLALIGVVAVAKRRKAVSLMVGVFALLTVGCAREETAWRTASETGTIQAYEEFLKRYPAGGFVGEAQTAITA